MPHTGQSPGSSRITSGCIGEIHLPASSGAITRPASATFDITLARTNTPGRSRPSALSTLTRTSTVRVVGSKVGSMNATRPVNVSSPIPATVNSTFWPKRSHGRSLS